MEFVKNFLTKKFYWVTRYNILLLILCKSTIYNLLTWNRELNFARGDYTNEASKAHFSQVQNNSRWCSIFRKKIKRYTIIKWCPSPHQETSTPYCGNGLLALEWPLWSIKTGRYWMCCMKFWVETRTRMGHPICGTFKVKDEDGNWMFPNSRVWVLLYDVLFYRDLFFTR